MFKKKTLENYMSRVLILRSKQQSQVLLCKQPTLTNITTTSNPRRSGEKIRFRNARDRCLPAVLWLLEMLVPG